MMPVELASRVLYPVELLHTWDEVLQLEGEGEGEREGGGQAVKWFVRLMSCADMMLTSVGSETGTRSELRDHAPAFSTLMFTMSAGGGHTTDH